MGNQKDDDINAAELALKAHVLASDPDILAEAHAVRAMEHISASVNLDEAPQDAVCSLVMDLMSYCERENLELDRRHHVDCKAACRTRKKHSRRLLVKDDLQRFHDKNMASDPHYTAARHLFELGEAVALLREDVRLTRGELGKRLRVKARDIAVIEEETPRAPAGLLEAALSLLVQMSSQKRVLPSAISQSIRTIRHFRPTLVSA